MIRRQLSTGMRVVLVPAQAGQSMVFALLAPIVPAIALFLGGGEAGVAQAQLVVVFPFLGLTLGSLAAGLLIRAVGVRWVGVMAAALYVVGAVLCIGAPAKLVLLAGAGLLGLGASWLTTALSSATAIALDEPQRGATVGLQAAVASLFSIVFGLISAALADRIGWRAPFGMFALFGLAMLVLASLFLKVEERADVPGEVGQKADLGRVWPVCLAGAGVFLIATTLSTQLPFLLEQNGVGSMGQRGIVMACTTLSAAVASFAFAGGQARFGARVWTLAGGAIAAGGWLAFAFWTGGMPLALVAAGLVGLGLGTALPMLYSAALRVVPPQASGQSVGLLNASIFVASFCNPWLATPLRAAWGLPGLMAILAIACLVLGLAAAWLVGAAPSKPA